MFYFSSMLDLPEYWQEITRKPIELLSSAFPSTNGAVFIAPIILFRWPRWSGALGFALALGGLVTIICFFKKWRRTNCAWDITVGSPAFASWRSSLSCARKV